MKEYALYKGDELLAMGTKREIAEQLGVSVNSVSHYGTPVYARRTSENGRRLVKLSSTTTICQTVSIFFSNKNDAINELHRLRGVKYRNSKMYTVELVECGG